MSRAETLAAETVRTALPGLWSKLGALGGMAEGAATMACKHLLDGAPGGMVCVTHPGAGVQCCRCMPHHIGRHGDEVEFLCDECDLVVERIHGLAIESFCPGLAVRDTRGRRRRMVGELWLIGCGVCASCWQASRRQAS